MTPDMIPLEIAIPTILVAWSALIGLMIADHRTG